MLPSSHNHNFLESLTPRIERCCNISGYSQGIACMEYRMTAHCTQSYLHCGGRARGSRIDKKLQPLAEEERCGEENGGIS